MAYGDRTKRFKREWIKKNIGLLILGYLVIAGLIATGFIFKIPVLPIISVVVLAVMFGVQRSFMMRYVVNNLYITSGN